MPSASRRTETIFPQIALIAVGLAAAPAAGAAGVRAGGEVILQRFHTTDLFPGGETQEADWGTRLVLKPEATVALGGGYKLKGWAKGAVERYDRIPDRNLDAWVAGADLKHGPHRLRLYTGWADDELYFLSVSGGAWLNRRWLGAEARLGLGPRWRAEVEVVRGQNDFVPTYDERDDHRWSLRTGGEVEWAAGRRAALSYVYRDARSVTDLYSYRQNSLRAEIEWPLPWRLYTEGVAQFSLRNYRTGKEFASNFGRQDERSWILGKVGRPLFGPVRAEVYGEWRSNDSLRPGKNYQVTDVGLALAASL